MSRYEILWIFAMWIMYVYLRDSYIFTTILRLFWCLHLSQFSASSLIHNLFKIRVRILLRMCGASLHLKKPGQIMNPICFSLSLFPLFPSSSIQKLIWLTYFAGYPAIVIRIKCSVPYLIPKRPYVVLVLLFSVQAVSSCCCYYNCQLRSKHVFQPGSLI